MYIIIVQLYEISVTASNDNCNHYGIDWQQYNFNQKIMYFV